MKKPFFLAALVALALAGTAGVLADEGMWRIDQLPYAAIARQYGVR